jgi:O-antigen/teichoic acid export membrane protein
LASLRHIAKQSGTYSVAVFFSRAASFLLLPLYTRYLNPADYGVLEVLDVAANLIALMAGSRLGQALFYYSANATDPKDRDRYVTTAFLGALAIGTAIAAIGIAASSFLSVALFGVSAYAVPIALVSGTVGCSLPLEMGLCVIRADDRGGLYTGLLVSRLLLTIIMNVVALVLLQMRVEGILASALISACAGTVFAGWYCLAGRNTGWDASAFRRLVIYSFPLALSALAEFTIQFANRLFLTGSVSLHDIGLFSLAYKIGLLITYIHSPFATYWNAQMFAVWKTTNGEAVYVRVCSYVAFVLIGSGLLLCLFATPLMALLTAAEFHSASVYVPWIVLACVLRALGSQFRGVFLIANSTAREARVTGAGAIVCLTGYAVLIPHFGVWGAIHSTLAGFAVMFVYGLRSAQAVRRVPFEYGRMAQLGLTAALIYGVYAGISPTGLGSQILAGLVCAIAYPCILLLTGFLNREERHQLRSTLVGLPARFAFLR